MELGRRLEKCNASIFAQAYYHCSNHPTNIIKKSRSLRGRSTQFLSPRPVSLSTEQMESSEMPIERLIARVIVYYSPCAPANLMQARLVAFKEDASDASKSEFAEPLV